MKKEIIIGLVVLALAVGAYLYFRKSKEEKTAKTKEDKKPLEGKKDKKVDSNKSKIDVLLSNLKSYKLNPDKDDLSNEIKKIGEMGYSLQFDRIGSFWTAIKDSDIDFSKGVKRITTMPNKGIILIND